MDNILKPFLPVIKRHFQVDSISGIQKIQNLWSNYGGIYRLSLDADKYPTVVVKCITLDEKDKHPRGWTGNLSHQRKLRSYQIETNWYKNYSSSLPKTVKVPNLLYSERQSSVQILVFEDLAVHYPILKDACSLSEGKTVVKWLAQFHAHFLNSPAEGLWETGSYWHLATRPDEWNAMADSPLKHKAKEIDLALSKARFQTIIHGDAKVANFCFGKNETVAAVDFQYVGMGVGVKDLAYFMGSCFTDEECELYEDSLLDYYFNQLNQASSKLHKQQLYELEEEWRKLYPLAWADFNRFLLGWLPGHQKLHRHALSKNKMALDFLDSHSNT